MEVLVGVGFAPRSFFMDWRPIMAKRELPRTGAQKQNTFFGGAAILAVGIAVLALSTALFCWALLPHFTSLVYDQLEQQMGEANG